jgi:hypothetical protein
MGVRPADGKDDQFGLKLVTSDDEAVRVWAMPQALPDLWEHHGEIEKLSDGTEEIAIICEPERSPTPPGLLAYSRVIRLAKMPRFYFDDIPNPPETENLDSYIEKKCLFVDNMRRLEARLQQEFHITKVAEERLRLARTARDSLIHNYRINLPYDNLDDLSRLRDTIYDEIEKLKHYKQEVEEAFALSLVDAYGVDGFTSLPAGYILFDDSDIEWLSRYLSRIDECISFLSDS